jgi:hypothetical protein
MTSTIFPHKEIAQVGSPREAVELVGKIGGDGWTLNDAIFAGTRSVTGRILAEFKQRQDRRSCEANHRPRHYDAHGCASAAKRRDARERPACRMHKCREGQICAYFDALLMRRVATLWPRAARERYIKGIQRRHSCDLRRTRSRNTLISAYHGSY